MADTYNLAVIEQAAIRRCFTDHPGTSLKDIATLLGIAKETMLRRLDSYSALGERWPAQEREKRRRAHGGGRPLGAKDKKKRKSYRRKYRKRTGKCRWCEHRCDPKQFGGCCSQDHLNKHRAYHERAEKSPFWKPAENTDSFKPSKSREAI